MARTRAGSVTASAAAAGGSPAGVSMTGSLRVRRFAGQRSMTAARAAAKPASRRAPAALRSRQDHRETGRDRGQLVVMTAAEGRPASRRRGRAAPLALPAGFAALLVVGALAAATGGG